MSIINVHNANVGPWPEKMVTMLYKAKAAHSKLSAAQLAKHLNKVVGASMFTRNMILGRLWRDRRRAQREAA